VQKLLYAILMVTKKLQHYFTNHEVTIIISFPLGEVVHSRDATRRISKWALELMGCNIKYVPRTTIKSQAGPTLLPSGRRSKPRLQMSPMNTEPYTSTGQLWDPARGPMWC
jgi:hypothetical protein